MMTNLTLHHLAAAFRPTLAYCNDLDTLLAGFMLKANLGAGLIYDAHEIYPEQFATGARSDIWHRFYTSLEDALIRHSDARFTVCDSLGAWFAERYGATGFVTVRNVPALRHLAPEAVLERRSARPVLLYHGAYFPYRGLDEIIEAAPLIENATIVFRGLGGHEAALRQLAADRGVEDRVTFVPPVGVHDLVTSASACDIGLNPFVNICKNTEFALPNKFFEYMMAGLALASSDLVEMRAVTRNLGVGVLFPDLAPRAIADTLNTLLADPDRIATCRAAAWHAARTRFHWERESQVFLDHFNSLFGRTA